MEEKNRDFMLSCFSSYNSLKESMKKNGNKSDKDYHDLDSISRNIINFYLKWEDRPEFSNVIENFKNRYIMGESRIERNETLEEKAGIGEIYDFICNYDFSKRKFNIFVNSMELHMKLYSKCVGKEFGGSLRTEQALLFDTNIEVVSPKEAMYQYNKYIQTSDKIMEELDKKDIFEYINGCLRVMVDLIRIQPFADGNKRTFRSLFNLMLKRKNLPPVYIGNESTDEFSSALLKSMVNDDYTELERLYIRLISDSIVEVGLKEEKLENEFKKK